MTQDEYEILDELYFIVSYEELVANLSFERDVLNKHLLDLSRKGWIRVFESPDGAKDINLVTESILTSSYFLASKKGLKAHNS